MASERLEVDRIIPADPIAIFEVLRSPQGHVSIDSTGMLMWAEGEPATQPGDRFLVHMDRDALRDYPARALRRHCLVHAVRAGPRDRMDDSRRLPRTTTRSRIRVPPRTHRRRNEGHRVLRLVRYRRVISWTNRLSDHLGDCVAGNPRHPRSDCGSGGTAAGFIAPLTRVVR
jgi:hypothetical protein